MAEITRPHFTIPDSITPEEMPRYLRLMVDFVAQQTVKQAAEAEATYVKKSDRVVADAIRIMEGEVSLDKAVRPTAGQVFYAIDGKYAAFGDGTTPAPTDPGTGPSVGSDHDLLSATHTDTVVNSPTRGSLIYANSTPAWDELVKPGSASVLCNDATDAVYRTIPTAMKFFPFPLLREITTTGAAIATQGTAPDAYDGWPMGNGSEVDFEVFWPLSPYWRTGTLTMYLHWAVTANEASNWQPVAEYLAVAAGGSLVAAGNDMAPGVVSANVTADTRQRTSMGTVTVAAGDHLRLVVGRNPGAAGDGYTGTVMLLGMELTYTPIY